MLAHFLVMYCHYRYPVLMADAPQEIDLTSLTQEQLLVGIGDMVLSLLESHRVVIAARRDDSVITFINPVLLLSASPESLAKLLLESWSEEQVEEFLGHIYG